jgi:hypothetical protein
MPVSSTVRDQAMEMVRVGMEEWKERIEDSPDGTLSEEDLETWQADMLTFAGLLQNLGSA